MSCMSADEYFGLIGFSKIKETDTLVMYAKPTMSGLHTISIEYNYSKPGCQELVKSYVDFTPGNPEIYAMSFAEVVAVMRKIVELQVLHDQYKGLYQKGE